MEGKKGGRQSSPPPRPSGRVSEVPRVKPASRCEGPFWPVFTFSSYLLFAFGVLLLFLSNCKSFIPSGAREPICGPIDAVTASFRPYLDVSKHWNGILKGRLDPAIKLAALGFTGPFSVILALKSAHAKFKDFGLIHAAVMMVTMAHVDWRVFESFQGRNLSAAEPPAVGPSDIHVAAVVLGFFTLFPLMMMYRLRSSPGGKCGCLSNLISMMIKLALMAWMFAVVLSVYEFAIKNVDTWKRLPSLADHTAVYWEKSAPHRERVAQAGRVYGAQAYAIVEDLGDKVLGVFQKKPVKTA